MLLALSGCAGSLNSSVSDAANSITEDSAMSDIENNNSAAEDDTGISNSTVTVPVVSRIDDIDYAVYLTFSYSAHEDDSNATGLYFDEIEFAGIDKLIGWSRIENVQIRDCSYTMNNQIATLNVSYIGTKDPETDEYEDEVVIDLHCITD